MRATRGIRAITRALPGALSTPLIFPYITPWLPHLRVSRRTRHHGYGSPSDRRSVREVSSLLLKKKKNTKKSVEDMADLGNVKMLPSVSHTIRPMATERPEIRQPRARPRENEGRTLRRRGEGRMVNTMVVFAIPRCGGNVPGRWREMVAASPVPRANGPPMPQI